MGLGRKPLRTDLQTRGEVQFWRGPVASIGWIGATRKTRGGRCRLRGGEGFVVRMEELGRLGCDAEGLLRMNIQEKNTIRFTY